MIPDLQCIIAYLQESTLGDVSFTLVLQLLANPTVINSATPVDHQTLLVRITTLLKSNYSITRWKATKLLTICLTHPVLLLSNHTANFLGGLVKILESKCFIANFNNPTNQEFITLKSTAECLGFVLDQIRGKPTLTREVLTPKLPAIIGSLIDVTVLIPDTTLPILSKILITNTTTFRPFGTRFETALRNILNNGDNLYKLNSELREILMKSFALVSFVLSREKQAESWRENVNQIILELKSVISIYEVCLELSNDEDYNKKFQSLPKLPENLSTMKLVFGTLSIDINESPIEIFKVSQRIQILTELLLSYIEINTPCPVSIPFGHYLTIGEILTSFNTLLTPVKKDIRDSATRKMIEQSVNECKLSGIKILISLINKFSNDLYPHIFKILAILDASIPILTINGKIKINTDLIYENEGLINQTLLTASKVLNFVERFNDMTVLGRLVESALVLKEPREPKFLIDSNKSIVSNSNDTVSASKKKNGKNKSVVSLSDILSHKQYFINPASNSTLNTVREFFNTLITKCELSQGKLTMITRFIIIDAVSNFELINDGKKDSKNYKIIELLENVLLYPGKTNTSVSIIPIISNLIGDNDKIYSLLVNPRFPILPKKNENDFNTELEMEEIEKEEATENNELLNGDFKIPDSNKRSNDEMEVDSNIKRQHVEEISKKVSTENNDFVFNSNSESAAVALKKLENELENEKHNGSSLADKVIGQVETSEDNTMANIEEGNGHQDEDDDDDDEELDSDFAIPEINVDED